MEGIKRTEIKNLILTVDKNYNRDKFDLDDWEEFLDNLCVDRYFQKEAIKTAIIYLYGGRYKTICDLLRENFNKYIDIKEHYGTIEKFEKAIQLSHILSGTIDMATGTGKSYVIFGIAYLAMALGMVKRVLVLCPSPTIADGLTEKFQHLITDETILNAVPNKYLHLPIRITDANTTIQENDICIENIHAVYERTGSSIKDSFENTGEDTLVLSDEVHHAYNSSTDQDIRKWKGFITNPQYKFKYHIGLTGTAYTNNDYFSDVIYRYSLRQAITDKTVKDIQYVAEDTQGDNFEKFQKIFQNHIAIKNKYPRITPISIIVTAKIEGAKNLKEEFVDFLIDYTKEDRTTIEKKVLIVTSDSSHKQNVQLLKHIDEKDCGIEWVISVSMLTEGWDCKNVFQIVPWEDRAFNSKLLISQVLGRGLRIPQWSSAQPKVVVFNHSNWSANIQTIVDEVLENETSLIVSVLINGERAKHNFKLFNLRYKKDQYEILNDDYGKEETFDINKPLELISQSPVVEKTTTYIDTKGIIDTKEYQIEEESKTVDEIAMSIANQFRSREREADLRNIKSVLQYSDGTTERDKLPTYELIKEYIYKCMKLAHISGDRLTYKNIDKINGKFTGLLRKKRTSPGYKSVPNELVEINTSDMASSFSSYSALRNDSTVFFSSNIDCELDSEQLEIFEFMKGELLGKQMRQVNSYDFKTPLNIVIVSKTPERQFIELLIKKEIAHKIDCWIKSRNVSFYTIPYILKRGATPKDFNPDFFIKVGNNIIVIETKADNDTIKENYSKMIDAKKHFIKLNEKLLSLGRPERYYFNMLSPSSYPTFEAMIKDGTYFNGFNSDLEDALKQEYRNKNS